MRAKYHRMIFSKLFNKLTNLYYLLWIKSNCRLIEYNDFRVAKKCLGEAHSLSVALGKVLYETVFYLRDAGHVHGICYHFFSIFPVELFELCHKFEILIYRHIHIKRWYLRQVSDTFFCFLRLCKYIIAVYLYCSTISTDISGNNIHGG